jgi:hypothetical protein
VAGEGEVYSYHDAKMRRQTHHFPSPHQERSTQALSLADDLTLVPFLEPDRSSVAVPVFYRRSLPKKIKLDEKSQERRSLIVEHEPEVCEQEPVVPSEVVKETKKEEVKETKPVTKLVMRKRDFKVKEIQTLAPFTSVVETKEEPPLETPPSYDRISVVMAFRGQGDGRLEGLKKCIQCLRAQTIDCYIILIEQDHSPVHQAELEPLVDSYLFTYSNVMFNKSWAFNCGVIIAPDDLVLLHDCDMLMPKNYVRESMRILGTKEIALPWSKILYLTEESSKHYPDGQHKISGTLTSHQVVGGSLIVRKSFYLRIGGMDERFEGWGGEDNAFYAKACKLGRMNRVNSLTGLTLLHHYHEPAQKSHPHNHINSHVLWQYYQGSDRDIMVRIRALDPIGDPFKIRNKVES